MISAYRGVSETVLFALLGLLKPGDLFNTSPVNDAIIESHNDFPTSIMLGGALGIVVLVQWQRRIRGWKWDL